jgi:hypothetical protein
MHRYTKLRREIQEQEELMRGYQKENEAAMASLVRQKHASGAMENELRAVGLCRLDQVDPQPIT